MYMQLILSNLLPKAMGLRSSYIKKSYSKIWKYLLVREEQYFFDSFFGREVSCNPLAIYRELTKRSDLSELSIVWVKAKDIDAPIELLDKNNVRFVEYGTFDYLVNLTQSKFVVHNNNLHPLFAPKPEQVICATWHGIPIKTLGVDTPNYKLSDIYNKQRSLNISDIHLSTGKYYDRYAIQAYNFGRDNGKSHHIGFPRNDAIVSAKKTRLPSAPHKPKLLYAPTWRGKGSSARDMNDEIYAAVETLRHHFSDSYDVLVKTHHLTNTSGGNDGNITFIKAGVSINDLLPEVDMLITDYSSVMIDFMILDRPIICFAYDEREYDQERGLIIPLEELPVAVCKSIEELKRAIMAAKRPSEYERYSNIKKKLLGVVRDDAAQRALELLHTPKTLKMRRIATKEVLIYAGAFMPNGITSSFLNLSHAIDPELVKINLVIPYTGIDANAERAELLNKTPLHIQKTLINFQNIPRSVRRSIKNKGRSAKIERNSISKGLLEYYAFAASRHLRNANFDVAIDFSGYSQNDNLLIAACNAERKIVFQHNDILAERITKQNVGDTILAAYRFFDKVVSVSEGLAAVNQTNFSKFIKPEQASFSRNLINFETIVAKSNATCEVAMRIQEVRSRSSSIPVFVSAGRFSPEKNHKRLLDAFRIVQEHSPEAQLWLLGDGPLFDQTRIYARQLGICNSCYFPGWVRNPFPAIKACSAFVLSSNYEGQPLVLLEAMTLGTSVIACTHPGLAYITEHGGILAKQDTRSLSIEMMKIANGYNPVLSFDPNAYQVAALNDFYTNVLGL